MAVRIANLKILISANTTGLSRGFTKAKTQVSGFQGTFSKFRAGFSKAIPLIAGITAGIASIATVTKLASIGVRNLVRQFDELDKLAKSASKLGVTADALQKVRFAAKLTGTEIQAADNAIVKFTKAIAESAEGTGESIRSLDAMGISAKDLIGLSLEEQLLKIADGFTRLGKEGRVLAAGRLFGRSGIEFVNLLKGGSDALDEMFQERGDLGLFTDEQLKRIESANDNMARLGIQINFIFGSISAAIAPVLDVFVEKLIGIGKDGKFNFDSITFAIRDTAIATGLFIDTIVFLDKKTNVFRSSMFGLVGLLVKFRKELKLAGPGIGIGGFDTPTADKVRSFFDDVDAKMKDIKANARDTAKSVTSITSPDITEDPIKPIALKPVQSLIATLPAALEKGTAAAFSVIARQRQGQGGIKDVAKWTQATVDELVEQSRLLRAMAVNQSTLGAAAL